MDPFKIVEQIPRRRRQENRKEQGTTKNSQSRKRCSPFETLSQGNDNQTEKEYLSHIDAKTMIKKNR
jgi:hypothetical protein